RFRDKSRSQRVRGQFSKGLIGDSCSPANDLTHGGILERLDNPVVKYAPKDRPVCNSKLQQCLHPGRERLGRGALDGFQILWVLASALIGFGTPQVIDKPSAIAPHI